jgi:hypothetical protein
VIDAIQEWGITFDAEWLSPLGDYSIWWTTFNWRFAILSSWETVFLNVGWTVIISWQQNNVIAWQWHTFRYLDAETIRVQWDSQTYREYIDSKNMSYVPKKEKKPRRDRRLKEPKENDE